MRTYQGKAIFGGIAIGPVCFYGKNKAQVKRIRIENPEEEYARYEAAKSEALSQLQRLYNKAAMEAGKANAQIFDAHRMMLKDEDFDDSVQNIISTQMVNAEYAVASTGDKFAAMFAEMQDEYFKARAVDVRDISERVLNILQGVKGEEFLAEPSIVAAEDLAPSETVQMDRKKLKGFVTRQGSANSHTSILARTMNIPALTGVDIQENWHGKLAVIDGFTGYFYVDPDEQTLRIYKERLGELQNRRALLSEFKGRESVTAAGHKVQLYANIADVADVPAVLENDAEGIGLFRSEFLYLQKSEYPTEEEQFMAYKMAAKAMTGKRVIIRTLDIGADKQADYFRLDREENPAMGYRAIRICLTRPDIFTTQLRAILRASAYGNLSVMYPMITSAEEIKKAKGMMENAKAQLDESGIEYGQVEQGIMIETPAAAIISDLLAKEVDFFSIGTNDLTQYTLAIDRQNNKLEEFYNPHHEAILRMIEMTVKNAHRAGIWAGICGELGADTALTKRFLDMGVDELSVPPSLILPIRKIICDN